MANRLCETDLFDPDNVVLRSGHNITGPAPDWKWSHRLRYRPVWNITPTPKFTSRSR
jgi:hypothetical protein